MNIEQYKQLDQLLLDEINVKEFVRIIANTEKGQLDLVFDGNDYFWRLGGERVLSPAPKLNFIIPKILEHFFLKK